MCRISPVTYGADSGYRMAPGLDISDPQVQEDRGGVTRLVVDHRDAWLVFPSM